MIVHMPRPRLPYLHREVTRHGVVTWCVRIGHGERTRIRAVYGTKEFRRQYDAAISKTPASEPAKPGAGSLQWLWDRYRDSSKWRALSMATRRQRANIMRGVLEVSGNAQFASIDRSDIIKGRERRSGTPSMARHFVNLMRGLFEWALDADLIKVNPAQNVKAPAKPTEGFHVWTDEELALFEAHWPIGTRERLAFDIMLYTGLRRGDAACLGRQHVRDGVLTIRTQKTGETVTLSVLPPLAASIAAHPASQMAFIATSNGKPMTKESFGNWFKDACRAAGVPGSSHGLRKAAATRMADNGATESQLEAVFGWRGGRMAAVYTRKANRSKLARSAAGMMLQK